MNSRLNSWSSFPLWVRLKHCRLWFIFFPHVWPQMQQKSGGQPVNCSYPSDQRGLQGVFSSSADCGLNHSGSTKTENQSMQPKVSTHQTPACTSWGSPHVHVQPFSSLPSWVTCLWLRIRVSSVFITYSFTSTATKRQHSPILIGGLISLLTYFSYRCQYCRLLGRLAQSARSLSLPSVAQIQLHLT